MPPKVSTSGETWNPWGESLASSSIHLNEHLSIERIETFHSTPNFNVCQTQTHLPFDETLKWLPAISPLPLLPCKSLRTHTKWSLAAPFLKPLLPAPLQNTLEQRVLLINSHSPPTPPPSDIYPNTTHGRTQRRRGMRRAGEGIEWTLCHPCPIDPARHDFHSKDDDVPPPPQIFYPWSSSSCVAAESGSWILSNKCWECVTWTIKRMDFAPFTKFILIPDILAFVNETGSLILRSISPSHWVLYSHRFTSSSFHFLFYLFSALHIPRQRKLLFKDQNLGV